MAWRILEQGGYFVFRDGKQVRIEDVDPKIKHDVELGHKVFELYNSDDRNSFEADIRSYPDLEAFASEYLDFLARDGEGWSLHIFHVDGETIATIEEQTYIQVP